VLSGWLDSNGCRVLAYTIAGAACLVAGVREQRHKRGRPELWPLFWFVTAGFYLAIAVGRAVDIGGLATELGRDVAIAHGWYAERHKYQAMVVGAVTAIWFVTVAISLWRVPARRRRYLPEAIVAFTLLAFIGVRAISLHQIDSLLYRRHLHEVKVDAVVELAGVVVATMLTFWPWRAARAGRRSEGRRPIPPSPVAPAQSGLQGQRR
jgi:hypothetical protein